MTDRRQFLGTLGRMLGAGGLLLPIGGKGALAIADAAKASAVPVTAAPLPFSADGLRLRELRRELHDHCLNPQRWPSYEVGNAAWRRLMCGQYKPLERQVIERDTVTWAHCVELAEAAWVDIAHQHWGRRRHDPTAAEALIDAVLTLGGGERYYWNALPEESPNRSVMRKGVRNV